MKKIKVKQTEFIQAYTVGRPEVKITEKEYECDKYEICEEDGKLLLINKEKLGNNEINVSTIVCEPLIDKNYKLFEFVDNEWILVDEYGKYN